MVDLNGERRSAVVLVVDRLGAGFLGPFGNTWIDTPCLNELASKSLIIEQAWIDSPDLNCLCRSLWQGGHAAWPASPDVVSLPQALRDRGGTSWLITDDPQLARHRLHEAFDVVELLETETSPVPQKRLEDTNLARLFSLATQTVLHERPDLVWIHANGMQGIWDAPLELRDQFVEPGDPLPPRGTEVPQLVIDAAVDQDEIQGWIWAYAGQVSLLDALMETLLDPLDNLVPPPLFLLMGARGFPLGEHGALGAAGDKLYSELVHVPLMLRFPGDINSVRSQLLVQPQRVHATLADWFGVPNEDLRSLKGVRAAPPVLGDHPLAVAVHGAEWAIRTPAWFARLSPQLEVGSDVDVSHLDCELFLKPDDYWDANDVADRCPLVVQQCQELLARLRQLDSLADLNRLLPLHESLMVGMD